MLEKMFYARHLRSVLQKPLRGPISTHHNRNLTEPIADALSTNSFGVFVVHTPPGEGLKTAAIEVLERFRSSGQIGGHLHLDLQTIKLSDDYSVTKHVKTTIGHPYTKYLRTIGDVVSVSPTVVPVRKPVVLLLNHWDDILGTPQTARAWASMIPALAEESMDCETFKILLLAKGVQSNGLPGIQEHDIFKLNGGKKIRKVSLSQPLWSRSQLQEVVEQMHLSVGFPTGMESSELLDKGSLNLVRQTILRSA